MPSAGQRPARPFSCRQRRPRQPFQAVGGSGRRADQLQDRPPSLCQATKPHLNKLKAALVGFCPLLYASLEPHSCCHRQSSSSSQSDHSLRSACSCTPLRAEQVGQEAPLVPRTEDQLPAVRNAASQCKAGVCRCRSLILHAHLSCPDASLTFEHQPQLGAKTSGVDTLDAAWGSHSKRSPSKQKNSKQNARATHRTPNPQPGNCSAVGSCCPTSNSVESSRRADSGGHLPQQSLGPVTSEPDGAPPRAASVCCEWHPLPFLFQILCFPQKPFPTTNTAHTNALSASTSPET